MYGSTRRANRPPATGSAYPAYRLTGTGDGYPFAIISLLDCCRTQSAGRSAQGGMPTRGGARGSRAAGKKDDGSPAATKRERRASTSSSKRAKQEPTADDAGGASASDAPKAQRTRVIFPPRENGAVGLPNQSGSDCFWLSTLQCIRHAPGYVDSLRQCTAAAAEQLVRLNLPFCIHANLLAAKIVCCCVLA
jgi:hypothetical protein